MSPNPPKKLSMAEQGGTRAYLSLTKHKHDGLDADDLLLRVKLGVQWTKIAKDFKVKSSNTVKGWYFGVLHEEGIDIDYGGGNRG